MRVAIHGCYDIDNFGDQVLATMLARRVESFGGIKSVIPMRNRGGYLWWLSAFWGVDACIYGGGGYLSERATLWGTIGHQFKYVAPALMLRVRGAPYSIFCPGASVLRSRFAKTAVRLLCNGAKDLIVRDTATKDLLISIGVPSEAVEVEADFVLSLEPDDITMGAVESASRALAPLGNKELIGIHLQSLLGVDEALFDAVCEALIATTSEQSARALVFISDHGSTAERHYNRVLQRHRLGRDKALVVPRLDNETTLALLARMAGVISTKLHVGIAAYALNVSAFSIWTHPKTPRFYEMVHRSDSHTHYTNWSKVLPGWLARIGSAPERERLLKEKTHCAKMKDSIDRRLAEVVTTLLRSACACK